MGFFVISYFKFKSWYMCKVAKSFLDFERGYCTVQTSWPH